MSNWFGDLQLAYKYVVVFLSLLFVTMLAGFIKVFFDRRKLKKAKVTEAEAGPQQDTVELNQREKDEGDLFGIRAIEAGFFAGVAQSRPTSRAGSVIDHPAMSNSTLVGGSVNSPLMKGQSQSNNNSVLSLNLGPNDPAAPRRPSPPTQKLRPSEAELTGRHGAVDMNLQVPPSPGHPRGPPSPTFGGNDSDSDEFTSPRSMSPRSADFQHQQYSPAPNVPMPDALKVSYHDGDENIKSQTASFNNSPNPSPTPLSPRGAPPTAALPTIPGAAARKESRSPSPERNYPRVQVHEPNLDTATDAAAPLNIQLQPKTYNPLQQQQEQPSQQQQHHRDTSDASSVYSRGNRLSDFSSYQAYHEQEDSHNAATAPVLPSIDETALGASIKEAEPKTTTAQSNNLLAPSNQPVGKVPRISEFYEAYYRQSQLGGAAPESPVIKKMPGSAF